MTITKRKKAFVIKSLNDDMFLVKLTPDGIPCWSPKEAYLFDADNKLYLEKAKEQLDSKGFFAFEVCPVVIQGKFHEAEEYYTTTIDCSKEPK